MEILNGFNDPNFPLNYAITKDNLDDNIFMFKGKMLRKEYLSKVAARMYLPLGENLTNETGGLSSSMSVLRHWPDVVSQMRHRPS